MATNCNVDQRLDTLCWKTQPWWPYWKDRWQRAMVSNLSPSALVSLKFIKALLCFLHCTLYIRMQPPLNIILTVHL